MVHEDDSSSLHIVMFPWLAFGHMLPFLELSKQLARKGHRISFISTPRNIQRLPAIPPHIAPLIHLVPLHLPRVEGLPETAEATRDIPPHAVPSLKKALDGLQQPFAAFINRAVPKPDWIIQDFLQHWVPPIAAQAGVPTVYFGTITASNYVFLAGPEEGGRQGIRPADQFTSPPPWVPLPSNLAYRPHEVRKLFDELATTKHASGLSESERVRAIYQACKALAIRSSAEAEPKYLPLLQRLRLKPVIPVGLLLPSDDGRGDGDGSAAGIIEWLNKQRPKSVVYIAFGSEVMLSDELMRELAHGIELARLPFLWALRRPVGDDGIALPAGFEERSRDYGLICRGWVPQLKILAHEAVGGFLTHAGWSSAIESLHFGVPLVLLPVFGDQWINARAMEESGYGVEIEREEEDGSFGRESVAKALKLVMSDEGGESYRNKAEQLSAVFRDSERQDKYIDGFVRFLLANRTRN